MFAPPNPLKERILLYGATGSGKTFAYLTICRTLMQYGSPAKFHVISTDQGVETVLYGEFPDIAHLVTVYPAYDWPEYNSQLLAAKAVCGPQDWLIVDLACKAWDAAQDHFTQRVYGADLAEYFLDVRAQFQKQKAGQKMGNPLDGRQDWPAIKSMFGAWSANLLMRATCNVLCAVKAKAVDSKQDSPKIMEEFGLICSKPAGNKDFPFDFNTSLYIARKGDSFAMRTHKDRARRYVNEPCENFALAYLYGVAGWQIS